MIAGDVEIRARRFVIATGSSPLVPPIPGLDNVGYLTNETVFDLTERPGHLIIIGGGPIGIELAQAFRRLGSQVTVIEAASALGRDDPEMVGDRAAQAARRGRDDPRAHQGDQRRAARQGRRPRAGGDATEPRR